MDGVKPEFREELIKLTNAERARHTSLLNIHVVPALLSYKKLLSQFGYDLNEHHDWGDGSGERTKQYIDPENESHEGAYSVFLKRPEGLKAVVFIRIPLDIEIAAHVYVMSMLHEMGHVDDCEHSLNLTAPPLRLGGIIKAEVYAHHYACAQMVENGYNTCLLGYISMREKDAADREVCDVYRVAATTFLGEAQRYRAVMARPSKQNLSLL